MRTGRTVAALALGLYGSAACHGGNQSSTAPMAIAWEPSAAPEPSPSPSPTPTATPQPRGPVLIPPDDDDIPCPNPILISPPNRNQGRRCNGTTLGAELVCTRGCDIVLVVARCQDGAWSCRQPHDAACAGHGGIECNVCPGPFC